MNCLIVYESLTGNSKTFVDYAMTRMFDKYGDDTSVTVINLRESQPDLSKKTYDKVVVGGYTWGNGKIPRVTKEFIIRERLWLKEQDLFLFGTGITLYKHFCGSVDGMKKIIGRNCPSIKFEQTFEAKEEERSVKLFDKYLEGEI